ncbi:hypothetical protein INT45_000218 [Circinella minor]|uniref:Uncharacterized protein n=1 Tax=Circinella minor TaxID=1195481 RepID=A0A8H7S267_9FUNG|nr:hypothetical protein INT45_000218 [Circinella minor]
MACFFPCIISYTRKRF